MAHRAATDEICVAGGMGNAPSSKRRGLVRVSACCLLAPKDLACQLRYDYYDKNPPFFQRKRLLKNFFLKTCNLFVPMDR